MAASVRAGRGRPLSFFGRGGRPVVRARPEGDGWWWLDDLTARGGAAIAAVGRGRGQLFDLDLAPVATVDDCTVVLGDRVWPLDTGRGTVGPERHPLVRVSIDDGVLTVRHAPDADRLAAVLVGLAVPARNPYVTPTSRPLSDETHHVLTGAAVGLAGLFPPIA